MLLACTHVAISIVAGFSTPAASYVPRLQASRATVRAQATAVDVVAATQDFLKTATGYYSPVDAAKLDDEFVFRAPTIAQQEGLHQHDDDARDIRGLSRHHT